MSLGVKTSCQLECIFEKFDRKSWIFPEFFCKVENNLIYAETHPGTTIVYKTGCVGRRAVGVVKLKGCKLQYRVLANTFFEVGNLKILEFSMSGNCEHIIVVVSHFWIWLKFSPGQIWYEIHDSLQKAGRTSCTRACLLITWSHIRVCLEWQFRNPSVTIHVQKRCIRTIFRFWGSYFPTLDTQQRWIITPSAALCISGNLWVLLITFC
jgi:hypothetical protein